MRRRLETSVLLLALAALAVGGCGDSSSKGDDATSEASRTGYEQVSKAIRGLRGEQRLSKLASLAKREGGELTLYTSINSEAAATLADEFEDTYDVEVGTYRAGTESVEERLKQEAQAGFRGADVAGLDGLALFNLQRKALLVDYDPAGVSGLVSGANRDGWTVSEFATFVVTWNTNRVPAGERPRSWQDLADPRWKGKLALESSDFEWYGTLRDHLIQEEGMSEAAVNRLFERMGRNAVAVTGHTQATQLLAAGEYDVLGTAFASAVDSLRKDGAPISRTPSVEPVIVRTNGVALVRHARHPAAAMLYLEWLVGDGQQVLLELGREPARRDLATTSGLRQVWEDYPRLVQHQEEWAAGYERALRNSK